MASPPDRNMLFFITPLICGLAALIFFLPKHKKTSSSSSTGTCPSDSTPPSSSSVDRPDIKYDVFVSFRGTDTRSGFLSHLREALDRGKINYFVDDQNLNPGNEISSTLLNAIKKSEIALLLFSEDYASSKWCLQELEQIIQCMENQKQIILPVFYKVDPSTVRNQKGKYCEAFDKHGERFDDDRLQKWKAALKRASDLSGFHSSNYNTEAVLIKEIVKRVKDLLRKTGNQNEIVPEGFVGIDKHILYLEAQLETKSAIGIWGKGGLGKTTIAEILYNRLRNKYEGSYLLYVKEELEKGKSPRDLKKDLLSKLFGEEEDDITRSTIPEHVDKTLRQKRVLIVLDDINDSIELEILIGGQVKFALGSRIIMTSRDRGAFQNCEFQDCEIYEVKELSPEDALQLFENNLQNRCFINKQELHEFSKMVVDYAKGVPLVIKVLGHDLSTVKTKLQWERKLEKLEKMVDPRIQDVLQISYDGLKDDEHKDIFLYLACFFKYESEEKIIMLLDACHYNTIDGLRVLENKALITIFDGVVSMHDLIRAMGHEIVRKRSPENLGQRSHLWDANDICKVLMEQQGTEKIESIHLIRTSELGRNLRLGSQAFAGMNKLRLLRFDTWPSEHRVDPPEEGFESLLKELRYFYWSCYPLQSFPLRCPCVNNLVELHFPYSNLKKLWDGVQELPSLKVINLTKSHRLMELPNLSKAPKLEYVNLSGCCGLLYVPLWPRDAWKYENRHLHFLPTSAYVLPSLQQLELNVCQGMLSGPPDNIDRYLPSLHTLSFYWTNIKALPKGITHLEKLTTLDVRFCKIEYIPELPPSIESFSADYCGSLKTVKFSLNSMHLSNQKSGLRISLGGCINLSEETQEAVALHYKLSTQRIIAGGKNSNALLYFPGSKVPKCFQGCCASHELVSVPLDLPLHSKAKGFIFYFLIKFLKCLASGSELRIKCHIELSNGREVKSICGSIYVPTTTNTSWVTVRDHVFLCHESSLSLKVVEELSRIKALATTDDGHTKVWFELLDQERKYDWKVEEWGVHWITSSEQWNLLEL